MQTAVHARGVGQGMPTIDTAHVASAGQVEDQVSGHLNSAANAARDQRDKAIATARARAALAGFTMHLIANDIGQPVFVLTKWHLTRALLDLAAVTAFLDQAGASHG